MNREEDQELWDLLGRSRRPQLSQFFARNVLREVREEKPKSGIAGRFMNWLTPKVLIPVSAIAVAVVAAVFVFRSSPPSPHIVGEKPPTPEMSAQAPAVPEPESKLNSSAPEQIAAQGEAESATAKTEPQQVPAQTDQESADEPSLLASIDDQDYDVISNLDDLLVLYESNLWDDNSSL